MSDDAVMTWKLGGVSLELRGVSALLPEHCDDLAPITTALAEFARKHGFVEPSARPSESKRMAVVRNVEAGEAVRVIQRHDHMYGMVGRVVSIDDEPGMVMPITVGFANGWKRAYRPSDLEWVGP